MKKVLIASVTVAVLLLACGEEEGVTPADPPPEATTPVNVLKNVEISFNRVDIKILNDVLSPNFVFYFDPRDVGQNPPGSHYIIPESWDRAELLKAVTKMFKKAFRISLSIETGRVGEPRPEATAYQAENVPTELLVMLDELNGALAEDSCTFEFERYLAEGGGKHWRLTTWRDRRDYSDQEPATVEPATIGKILALFYTL